MKNAIEWFKEKGFTFDDKITIADVIALQNDARKDGLMTAQAIASPVIAKWQKDNNAQDLSGLQYFVTDAIVTEADKLTHLTVVKVQSHKPKR
jgi:hypothetical protein